MEDVISYIFAAYLVGLSATIPPGTIFTMTITESIRKGFKAGFMVILGHAIVEVGVVLMLILGLGLILASEMVRLSIGVLGGCVLLWMGFDTVRGAFRRGINLSDEAFLLKNSYNPIIRGFIACISNPYFIIWWASVGGTFILNGYEYFGWMSSLVFLIIHWASDFPWFCFIALSVSRGRRFLSKKIYLIIIGICGVSLSILGLIYLKDGLLRATSIMIRS
jgi:threonine/homoserine/homoserine lactone efflux protein